MLAKVQTWNDAFNNNIDLWEYSHDEAKPNILLIARFHGDEPEGEFCLEQMLNELSKHDYDFGFNLYILPCLNPSGKKLFTRGNGHAIDLNRNYPTQNFSPDSVNPHTQNLSAGQPASEIETNIVIDLVKKYDFKRILSIHSDLHLIDYDGPAKDLAFKFSQKCGYRLVDNIGYPTNGSFGTWAGVERQIPLITVETWHAQNDDDMMKIWAELRPAIFDFCQSK